MSNDIKIFLIIAGIMIILTIPYIIVKIIDYRTEKYNNEIKNKLGHTVEYLFGKTIKSFIDHEYLCYTRYAYEAVCAKAIFVDKKNPQKIIDFAKHVMIKYRCAYTMEIWYEANRIKKFATTYKTFDDYLFNRGINDEKTMKDIAHKHKDEIRAIEKEKMNFVAM